MNHPNWLSKEQTRKVTELADLGFEYYGIVESDDEETDFYYLVGEGEDWRFFYYPQMFGVWFPSNEAYFSFDFPEWSDETSEENGEGNLPTPSEASKAILEQILRIMQSEPPLDPSDGIQLELALKDLEPDNLAVLWYNNGKPQRNFVSPKTEKEIEELDKEAVGW